MQILTNNKNIVFNKGEVIEKGIWENDPNIESYRIKNGEIYQYAVIADFKLYEVEALPEDFELNKYCYTQESGFYLNPDYDEPITDYQKGYEQALLDLAETTETTK